MNKIKFSHGYFKLRVGGDRIKSARLLQIFKCHYDDLGERFVKYDTIYWDKGSEYHNPYYFKLPKTKLLILLFKDIMEDILFTTIRRYTPEKHKYYKSKMGEIFEIVIEENEWKKRKH